VPMLLADPVVTNGAAAELTVVGSIAVLFARFVSPPPETLATLVRLAAALAATFTVTVIGGNAAPDTKTSERVQVSVPKSVLQPEPLIAVAVNPTGNASVTVMEPLEAAGPTFVMTIAYVSPTSPWKKLPECDFRIARSATVELRTLKLLDVVKEPPSPATV